MRRFDKTENIAKANLLAEQRYLETKKMINESLMTNDELAKLESPLDRLVDRQQPIEHIAKEVRGGYEILDLHPYELIKGYKITQKSHNVWGLYDKNVIDHEMATLITQNKYGNNIVTKYRINYT
jgi:hypothetical protein